MNEQMQQARDAALSVLQPSRRDLEHGLELHRHSVVCDAYGFAPTSAVDGEALRLAIEAGASDLEIQDLAEEMSMTRHISDPQAAAEFRDAWDEAGVTCIVQNAGEENQSVKRLIKRLARFIHVADRMPDFVAKAVQPDDIVAAKERGRHCYYMSGNAVPLSEDWLSVEEELGYIRTFFQLGHRIMHLTYNRRNMIGDGCMEEANAGLSDFGRAVVAEMNRVGVIVDVAHAGWQTSLEAARVSRLPMVASHSGCVALNVHRRSKPDEVIRAIVDGGGYIGICCIPHFLGLGGDITALLDHIDHVARTFGVDHVAIGTDTAHRSMRQDEEMARVPERRRARPRWESFWLPGTLGDRREGGATLSLAWTNWPLFTVGLVQRGYSDDDIRKIIGGNVLRVARAAWGAAA